MAWWRQIFSFLGGHSQDSERLKSAQDISIPQPELEPFKITLMAKASRGGAYPVTFTCRDNRVWLKCGCTAGRFSCFCKHKFHLLDGNPDWLADPEHQVILRKIKAIIDQTGFPPLLNKYKMALVSGNNQALKAAKLDLKMAMRKGR